MKNLRALFLAAAALMGPKAAYGAACSQLGHWYWPQEADNKSFSGQVDQYGFVKVDYFQNATGRTVRAALSHDGKTKTFIYQSSVNSIAVVTETPGLDAYTVAQGTPGYLPHVAMMRDLIGYAGAPYTFFLSDSGPADFDLNAINLVNYFDGILRDNQYFMPNCILYARTSAVEDGESCQLTAGPVPQLGSWDSKARSVWVRDGFNFALLQGENLDKSGGFQVYSGSRFAPGVAETKMGGNLFILRDQASLEASSVICQPANVNSFR